MLLFLNGVFCGVHFHWESKVWRDWTLLYLDLGGQLVCALFFSWFFMNNSPKDHTLLSNEWRLEEVLLIENTFIPLFCLKCQNTLQFGIYSHTNGSRCKALACPVEATWWPNYKSHLCSCSSSILVCVVVQLTIRHSIRVWIREVNGVELNSLTI